MRETNRQEILQEERQKLDKQKIIQEQLLKKEEDKYLMELKNLKKEKELNENDNNLIQISKIINGKISPKVCIM